MSLFTRLALNVAWLQSHRSAFCTNAFLRLIIGTRFVVSRTTGEAPKLAKDVLIYFLIFVIFQSFYESCFHALHDLPRRVNPLHVTTKYEMLSAIAFSRSV